MKKNYLLLLVACSNFLFSQSSDLVITGVYDGSLNRGTPKGIELIALADIPDLSIYGVGSANNGGGSDGEEFTLSGSVKEGEFIYIATETIEFNNFFGFNPTLTSGSMAINGDDAVELFKNNTLVDVFGDQDTDGSGEAWEYLDGWAYSNNDRTPSTNFISSQWQYSGPNALDGETSNRTATTAFPVAAYKNATLSNETTVSKTEEFIIHPNPTKGDVTIKTSSGKLYVEVYSSLGNLVLAQTVIDQQLYTSTLPTGVYFVKISINNIFSKTEKLIIE